MGESQEIQLHPHSIPNIRIASCVGQSADIAASIEFYRHDLSVRTRPDDEVPSENGTEADVRLRREPLAQSRQIENLAHVPPSAEPT